MRKIEPSIRGVVEELSNSRGASMNAAKAIMTTDTTPKEIAVKVDLSDGTQATIAGIAKGAGMIRPKMQVATMLAFVVTDAAIPSSALRACLSKSVDNTFNMVNIDGDTSTNDMALVLANGKAKNKLITLKHQDRGFQAGLDYVLTELAWMLVKDAEGASRVIEVQVKNAKSDRDARDAALAVVGSNLVKAAVFGRDPNWGRVIAALGYSRASFNPCKISLELASERGRTTLISKGNPKPRGMKRARDIMRGKEIEIHVDLAAGKSQATAWGSDLSYEYVRINSRYTT
jgi:glutamate N-acetyltransferase/amino-acid N-acetyltransferase